ASCCRRLAGAGSFVEDGMTVRPGALLLVCADDVRMPVRMQFGIGCHRRDDKVVYASGAAGQAVEKHNMNHRFTLSFVFVTLLIDSIGFGIIIPVMPQLIMSVSGEGLSSAARFGGLMMMIYALMQFLCSPIMGGISDRFGRRPVLLFSLLLLGIDYLIMAWAPTLLWLFAGRMIAGIAAS